MIKNCRLCQNVEFVEILDLGHLCLTGIFPKENEEVPRFPLRLVRCLEPSCELLQLADNQPLEMMYGENYGYRSGLNKSMVSHIGDIAYKCMEQLRFPAKAVVLDIGSSDATMFAAMPRDGVRKIGIDPSAWKYKDKYEEVGAELIHEFFGTQLDPGSVDLVTSIAMFYDLEDPVQFARRVNRVLKHGGIWILEVAYAPKIIGNLMYDSVCHEHLEYYGLKQLRRILSQAGFFIREVEFNDTNGGSILLVAQTGVGRDADEVDRTVRGEEGDDSVSSFAERVVQHKDAMLNFFSTHAERKIFGLGASTKGNVLLQYCGITPKQMPFIADVNEEKFGRYCPGTKIPIISEASAKMLSPDIYFVLPYHFRSDLESRYAGGPARYYPLPHPELVS